MSRLHLLHALMLFLPLTAGESWIMPDDQRRELDALVEQAIALGLPDARGGTLYAGTLTITRPGTEPLTIDGLHVQLADGTWLIQGSLRLDPRRSATIDAMQARAQTPAELGAHLTALSPLTLTTGENHPGPAIVSQWDASADGIHLVLLNDTNGRDTGFSDDWTRTGIAAATTVMAVRCGVPGAERGAVGVARWAWMVNGDDHGLITPLNLGRQWTRTLRDPPPPVEALRRGLIAWFRRHAAGGLPAPFLGLPPTQAATAMRALLPADAVVERAEIDALLAQPHDITASASFSERLAGYLAPPRESGVLVTDHAMIERTLKNWDGMSQTQRDAIPAERQSTLRWLLTCRFGDVGLDQLVAVVGDLRPSRWLDRGHPRTVGDQALRLLAHRLGLDPRVFTTRDVLAPWTAEERRAVASELSAWWRTNHQKPTGELVLDALPRLSVQDISGLLASRSADGSASAFADPEMRNRLFDRLAVVWAAGPPTEAQGDLDGVVTAGADHPAFAAMVDGWPITEPMEWLLVPWHAGRGRPQYLNAAIQRQLDAGPGVGFPRADFFFLLPAPALLPRLQQIMAGDVEDPRFTDLSSLPMNHTTLAHRGDHLIQRRALAMRLVLAAQLLADQRPISIAQRRQCEQEAVWMRKYNSDDADQPQVLATDLRVADVSASTAQGVLQELESGHGGGRSFPGPVNLNSAINERDEALEALIDDVRAALPALLIEVGWSSEIPRLKLPAVVGEILTVPF